MKEASELIGLGFNLNGRPGIALYVLDMASNLILEVLHIMLKLGNDMFLLKDLQVFLGLIELYQVLNSLINAILESFQFIKSLIREIFRRWLIFLHTFKITDYLLGA
jgi:hypothetical protein